MPELPEVESFRRLLLPLVGKAIEVRRLGDNHRIQLEDLKEGASILCTDVIRRGKQLCLAVTVSKSLRYMYLHMGMTGQIRVYGKYQNWGDIRDNGSPAGHLDVKAEDESSPPKYTYLIFSAPATNYTAYFCDPRKFGSCYLANDLSDLNALAPDALTCNDTKIIEKEILPSITNQRLGIKAILLDQKRAVSGVGNWIADEVLYQCGMHPDQTRLDSSEALLVWQTLQHIVSKAVHAQIHDESYPVEWLFHYRWTGKKAGRDSQGRTITFVTSGGRTSAIVLAQQKLYARTKTQRNAAGRDDAPTAIAVKSSSRVTKVVDTQHPPPVEDKTSSSSKRKRSRPASNPTDTAKEYVELVFRRKSPRLQALLK
jgi:formamidopyrimidine-DNA glycosylase